MICVSLRMAASAEAPSDLISLSPRLPDEGRSGDGERVASMSTGADRRGTQSAEVRAAGGVLERLQRGVALEALGESGCSFGTEVVPNEAASTGAEVGAEVCQRALTQKQTLGRRRTPGW